MLALIISSTLFIGIHSHSWVRCADYQGPEMLVQSDYDESQCHAWIRDWQFEQSWDGSPVAFASDRGVNHQVGVGSGQNLCQGNGLNTISADYSNDEKIARYTSGQQVRVVWPAKNHANYECFGNIPDTSMKLYMNPQVNPTTDISNTEFSMTQQGYQLVKDWHEGCTPGTDGCGFQNCVDFCSNTGTSPCFGDFTVPSVTQSGYYTFVWYWIFNPGSPYISCWEAYISADNSGTPATPFPSKNPTQRPTNRPSPSPIPGVTDSPVKPPTRHPTPAPFEDETPSPLISCACDPGVISPVCCYNSDGTKSGFSTQCYATCYGYDTCAQIDNLNDCEDDVIIGDDDDDDDDDNDISTTSNGNGEDDVSNPSSATSYYDWKLQLMFIIVYCVKMFVL